MHIWLDTTTASLGPLMIEGTLTLLPSADTGLIAASIIVEATGALEGGTEFVPYTKNALIRLTGLESGRVPRYVPDVTASTGTGNGTLNKLSTSTGALAETVTVTWTGPTTFTVAGSVSGALGAGNVGTLFSNRVRFLATAGSIPWIAGDTRTIVLAQRGFRNSGTPRSLQVMPGGRCELWGVAPAVLRTRLNADLNIGSSTLILDEPVTWKAGSKIVVGPSDYNDTTSGICETFIVAADVNGSTSVPVTAPATRYKWGRMQYVTDAGMSLTPGPLTNDGSLSSGIPMPAVEWELIPKTLDERAPVAHLSRNIVIEGIADASWTTSGFGAHLMAMGLSSKLILRNVGFRNVGQAGVIGAYPIHLHMLSYNMPDGMNLPSDGTFLGATSEANHRIEGCVVDGSSQRAFVTHGTHGAVWRNNIGFNIVAHAFFLEDGAEELNTIVGNTIMQVSAPTATNRLLDHETSGAFSGKSSGYWLPNPNNRFTDNWAFACAGPGIWNAFAGTRCFGLSEDVAISPTDRPVLEHARNIAACNATRGLMTEAPPQNNKGDASQARKFNGFLVGDIMVPGAASKFDFVENVSYKNRDGAYLNRVAAPGFYLGWTVADNEQVDFSGQADHDLELRRTLMVGVSLNNGNSAETRATNTRRAAFISYDEGFVVQNIIAVNYPARTPPTFSRNSFGGQSQNIQGGALVRMGEYIFPVWSFTRYSGWKLINCATGYMCQPPHLDGQPITLAEHKHSLGILRDVEGVFTGVPGRSVVWNVPFLTYDAINLQGWHNPEGAQTDTVYYGCTSGSVSGVWDVSFQAQQPISVQRQDAAGNIVGVWNVPDSRVGGGNLSHFKPVAVAKGGIYKFGWAGELPSGPDPYATFSLTFFHDSSDSFTLGVDWPNATPVGTVYLRWRTDGANPGGLTNFELVNTIGSPPRPYAVKLNNVGMTSRADVIADTSGLKFWQDSTNNVVWIKVRGDLVYDEPRTYNVVGAGGAVFPGPELQPGRNMGLSIRALVLP